MKLPKKIKEKVIRDEIELVWEDEQAVEALIKRERERSERMETSGQWLEKALLDLSMKIQTGLGLDADMISGLVSYCEMASPLDAKEYLDVILQKFPLFLSRCVYNNWDFYFFLN